MEACIEALYTIDGDSDKRKTLEMIRVLKGAISVSKSRTGEVIYHYNRHEKKALSRQMAKFDRDTHRSKVNIECQKRDVLRKWNLVFGRQRKFTESMRGFDDMLDEAISTRQLAKSASDQKEEEEEEADKTEEEKEEKAEEDEKAEEVPKMPLINDPRKRRLGIRPLGAGQGVVATPAMVGVLPRLNAGSNLHNARIETEEEEKARKEKEAEEERQRKARQLPTFDKELMETYLTEQKTLHQDLLTRNKLLRIRSSLDKDHVFFKYRLKSRLPDSAPDLLNSLERQNLRSGSAVTWAGPGRSRSGLSTQYGGRLKSSKSCQSGAGGGGGGGGSEVELDEASHRLEKTALTARPPSSRVSSELLPLERAKTVHFS